jgi:hypothetical protein
LVAPDLTRAAVTAAFTRFAIVYHNSKKAKRFDLDVDGCDGTIIFEGGKGVRHSAAEGLIEPPHNN